MKRREKYAKKKIRRNSLRKSISSVVCGRRANWKIEVKTITLVAYYVRSSSRNDLPRAWASYVMDFGRSPMKSFIDRIDW